MTLKQAARDAIGVQDACNIRGVCNSLNNILRDVLPIGSQRHPIVYLFLYKLMSLNGHEPLGDWSTYDWATTECRKIIDAVEVAPDPLCTPAEVAA